MLHFTYLLTYISQLIISSENIVFTASWRSLYSCFYLSSYECSLTLEFCWQGLEQCSKLEELSFDNNSIRHIEGAAHWPQLQRLSLADNLISSVSDSGLDCLTRLQHLSLENNCVMSLEGFQHVSSLTELFLSNNLVDNTRSVFFLKVEFLSFKEHLLSDYGLGMHVSVCTACRSPES